MAKHLQKLATRYARSLFQAAGRDPAGIQRASTELRRFVTEWWNEPMLSEAMQNPMFKKEERLQAIRAVCEKAGMSETVSRFVQVVFERDRIAALPQIAVAFSDLADEQAGIVKVQVVTAQAVSEQEKHSVEESLRRKIKGSLHFSWQQDPEILGGMLVTYGAKVLDGSLRGRLERIERQLNA